MQFKKSNKNFTHEQKQEKALQLMGKLMDNMELMDKQQRDDQPEDS